MSIAPGRQRYAGRIPVLWGCTGLFLLRVIGQVEVLLLSPTWLPPMRDWYSGLLPYQLLLPVQIVLLMAMAVITSHEMRGPTRARSHRARWQRVLRVVAICYFVAMLLRLTIQLLRGAHDVIDAGGVPIAFHWILALFLLVLARENSAPASPA